MFRSGIRTIAIALIAFPEPLTTGVGIAMLFASFAIPRQDNLSAFGEPEELIRRSIQRDTKPADFRRLFTADKAPVFHPRRTLPPEQPEAIAEKPTITLLQQNSSWFDNRRVSANVLHHTLKTSFSQYEATQVQEDKSCVNPDNQNIKPGIIHHKLKSSLIPDITGNRIYSVPS